MRPTTGLLAAAALGFVAWTATPAQAPTTVGTPAIKNLQQAFVDENAARARYLAFARKADEDGYHSVAALFRAMAVAEEVHAASMAAALRKNGVQPASKPATPEAGSTEENLLAAAKTEEKESLGVYPALLEAAKAEGNTEAVRAFKVALAAETEHARLCRAALADLPNWKAGDKLFVVCLSCGFTTADTALAKCPTCGLDRARMYTAD